MLILQTLLNLIVFLIISFGIFYLLGFLIIQKSPSKKNESSAQKLDDVEVLSFSLSLGIVIFVLVAILFGFLQLRFLVLPILLGLVVFGFYKFKLAPLYPWKVIFKDKLLALLLLLGILIQGFINFPSGFLYEEGLYFWSSQGHDGIWHVALMEEIKKSFPPQNPIFSGEPLYNYHFLVDVLMGEFARIFPFLTSLDLYFRFFPVLFSFLIGISVFAFVSRWQNSKQIGYLAVFFTYFTGSFGYVVKFIKDGNILGGETVFWASQINTILGNPPHAVAISLLTTFFLAFYLYLQERKIFWFIISFILASILAGFKVSGGVVLLVGLGVAAGFDLLFNRRFATLLLCGLLGISNFVTIKLMTRGAEGFLMFLPWWFVRTMVVSRLDWMDLEFRRQHYLAQGTLKANLRVVQLELEAFLIFLVGNMGMRILGFYQLGQEVINKRFAIFKNQFEVMLLVTMVTGFLIPMFFVQRGIIYNNIQFMQYFLLIFGFYAAIATYKFLTGTKNRFLRILIVVVIVGLSVPTVVGNLVEFYGKPPLSKVTKEELVALDYLRNHSDSEDIILTMPFNKYLYTKFPKQPWPNYAWYSTAYIPALTSRLTYLSSEEQALITNYPMKERLEKMKTFFDNGNVEFNKIFLIDEGISFIYLNKDEVERVFSVEELPLEVFFENNKVIIYKHTVK